MAFLRGKKSIIIATGLSILAVLTTSLSTLAWFQITSQPIKTDIVSADPNIEITNIDGIKKEEVIDPTTGERGISSLVTRKTYSNEGITNTDVGTTDTNFDVPNEGVGYYLLRKNPTSGAYKFNDSVAKYRGTLLKYDYADANRCYCDLTSADSKEIDLNDSFIIKQYTFDTIDGKNQTVVNKIDISGAYPTDITTYDNKNHSVSVSSEGSYRVWFDTSTKKISFEDISRVIEDKNKPQPQQLANAQNNSGVERKSRRNADSHHAGYNAILYGTTTGSGAWSDLYNLYYRSQSDQYEGVFYIPSGAVFGFKIVDSGGTQQKWIGWNASHHPDSTYFQASGSDIKCKTSGVYQIYIKGKVDDYNETFWIWDNNDAAIIKLSNTPYLRGVIKGQDKWGSNEYPFAWNSTNKRYSITVDLHENDEIKIYRNSDIYTGYNDNLRGNSSAVKTYISDESSQGNNIIISKKGKFTIYLGGSYWFYDDTSYTWIDDASADSSGNCFYYSYMDVVALHDVTFVNANPTYGTISSSSIQDVPHGSSITVSSNTITINGTTVTATPTDATGYTTSFNGWSNVTGSIVADRTITASFNRSPKSLTITYKDKGGSNFSGTHEAGYPTTHTYGTATTLKTAQKSGYRFDGWYYDSACTSQPTNGIIGATAKSSSFTLYAKWTSMNKIKLNHNGNDVAPSTDYYFWHVPGSSEYYNDEYGKNLMTTTNNGIANPSTFVTPTRSGFFLSGYAIGSYSVFSGVTFEDGVQAYIDVNGHITEYAITDSDAMVNIDSKSEIYAKWEQPNRVNIDQDGGTSGSEYFYHVDNGGYYLNSAGTQEMKERGVVPDVSNYHVTPSTKTGYTLQGYKGNSLLGDDNIYIDANGYITNYAATHLSALNKSLVGTTSVKAVWAENTIVVSFDANGGAGSIGNTTYSYTGNHNLPTSGVTKVGYNLIGWCTNSNPTAQGAITYTSFADNRFISVGESLYLYAVWEAITYSISYDYAGGVAGGDDPTSGNRFDTPLVINNPTKVGCIFDGWTAVSGLNTTTALHGVDAQHITSGWNPGSTLVKDTYFMNLTATSNGTVSLIANWHYITYRVSFSGDTIPSAAFTATYETVYSIPKPASREGYSFMGWKVSKTIPGNTAKYGDTNAATETIAESGVAYGGTYTTFYYKNLTSIQNDEVVLTSVWVKNQIIVHFYANGGTEGAGFISEHTYVYDGTDQELPNNVVTLNGYHQSGWNTNDLGTGTTYTVFEASRFTSPNEELNLYAYWVWTVNVYDPMKIFDGTIYCEATGLSYYHCPLLTETASGSSIYTGEVPKGTGHITIRDNDRSQTLNINAGSIDVSSTTYNYYVMTGINAKLVSWTGASAVIASSNTKYTVKAFDGSTTKNVVNNPVYAYAYNSKWLANRSDGDPVKQFTSGFQTINSSTDSDSYQAIYATDISIDYDSFGFFDTNDLHTISPWAYQNNLQESTFYSNSEYLKRYYVVNTLSSHRYEGTAYYSILSTHTNTYYFNDHKENKWSPVIVLASVSGDCFVGDGYGNAGYYANNSGEPMNQTNLPAVLGNLADDTWKIEISETYDSIVFWDGVIDQETGEAVHKTKSVPTSGNNNKYYVLTGTQNMSGNWLGAWTSTIYTVKFKASYFITDANGENPTESTLTNNGDYWDLASEKQFGIYDYTAEYVPTPQSGSTTFYKIYADEDNSILYCFLRDTTDNKLWYSDATCNTQTADGSSPLSGNDLEVVIYTKMVAYMNKHRTLYIDINAVNSWGGVNVVVDQCGPQHDQDDYFPLLKIADNLYRVTLPVKQDCWDGNNGWLVQFHKPTPANSGDWATQFDPNSYNSLSIIAITNSTVSGGYYDGDHTYSEVIRVNLSAYDRTDFGYAVVQTSSTGASDSWTDLQGVVLRNADGDVNTFFYELGAEIPANTYVRIARWPNSDRASNPTIYGLEQYSGYDSGKTSEGQNYGLPHFLAKDSVTQMLKTADIGTQRYNFYLITDSDKISIAMVPNLGNGYYIMPYVDANHGTDHYIGAYKMFSTSDNSAIYNGFRIVNPIVSEVKQPVSYFIRSYINAVDTLYCDGVGTRDGNSITLYSNDKDTLSSDDDVLVTLNIATGVITFNGNSQGYYDIIVENRKISIKEYESFNFFSLNTLDTSSISDDASIIAQGTGLILEVTFNSNNKYDAKTYLEVNNELSKYVGVAMVVTSTQLETNNDVYALLSSKHTYLSNGSIITGKTNDLDPTDYVISANTSSDLYAYIIIDYLPGNMYGDFLASYSGRDISFYLKTVSI